MSEDLWHIGSNGELFATIHDVRLVIRRFDGFARYLILQRSAHGNYPESILGSGTESDVTKAMVAAKRAAMRAELILSQRSKMSEKGKGNV